MKIERPPTVRLFNTFEPVTTFYRDLLPYLAQHGIKSEVFISEAEYRQGGRENLSDTFSTASRIQIRPLSAMRMRPIGRAQKLGIMLFYILGSMRRSMLGRTVDINFFLTQPPLFNLWGWVLRIVRRQPYICLVMDLYPDVAIKAGLLSPDGLLSRLLSRLSRFVLRRADAVIVIGRCMAERVQEMGLAVEKVHFVPNWANPEVIYPIHASSNCLRQELGLHDKFVVLYSGNMGVSHNFDDLLEVIYRCQEEEKLHFVLIGDGSRRNQIEDFIGKHELQNVTLLPFQPLERLAESLSLGDVHFVSLRNGFEGLVVPSKVYGSLAAGRAIIYQGQATGEIARMIQEENVGTLVPPQASDELEQAIRNYLRFPTLARNQGLAAHRLAQNKYSATRSLEKYYQIIRNTICD